METACTTPGGHKIHCVGKRRQTLCGRKFRQADARGIFKPKAKNSCQRCAAKLRTGSNKIGGRAANVKPYLDYEHKRYFAELLKDPVYRANFAAKFVELKIDPRTHRFVLEHGVGKPPQVHEVRGSIEHSHTLAERLDRANARVAGLAESGEEDGEENSTKTQG